VVDEGLAQLSNNLSYSAIAVYVLAMVLYAAELAFGGRGVVARTAAAAANPAGRADHPSLATSDDDTPAPGARWDADRLGRSAVALTVLGFGLQLAAVATRGLAAHRVPWGNMYEFSSIAALLVTGVFLVLLTRQDVRFAGFFVMAPVVLTLGLAVTVLYTDAAALVPALQSYWLLIHVSVMVLSFAILTVGAVLAAMYLWQQRSERRGSPGALARRLPDAASLDRMTYRVHAFAFPLFTFAVIAGAIWAESAWGRYWGWDPKETWSFITWVVYAAYLHARSTGGWRGRRATVIAVAGYAAFLFNYFGVNILFSGLHSYGGV
jgi:cytochrome c-type biogenesis protein CcsB